MDTFGERILPQVIQQIQLSAYRARKLRPNERHNVRAKTEIAPVAWPCPAFKQEKTRMTSSFRRNAIVLGLLSAVGPFAIDMYLPALPSIAADLHATPSATQMTLIAVFVSLGLCQIVYGPLSDVYGRKLPLYGGLT